MKPPGYGVSCAKLFLPVSSTHDRRKLPGACFKPKTSAYHYPNANACFDETIAIPAKEPTVNNVRHVMEWMPLPTAS